MFSKSLIRTGFWKIYAGYIQDDVTYSSDHYLSRHSKARDSSFHNFSSESLPFLQFVRWLFTQCDNFLNSVDARGTLVAPLCVFYRLLVGRTLQNKQSAHSVPSTAFWNQEYLFYLPRACPRNSQLLEFFGFLWYTSSSIFRVIFLKTEVHLIQKMTLILPIKINFLQKLDSFWIFAIPPLMF